MDMKKLLSVLILVASVQSGALFAGANNLIELSDDPAATVGGQTLIEATWTDNAATSNSLQFDIVFDNAAFTFNNCAVQAPYNAAPYFSTCLFVAGPNVVRFTSFQIPSNPIASGNVIDVTFDVNGPPGMYQMTVSGIVTLDGETTDTDPAMITVLGASYASVPAPPGPFNFGSLTMGVDPDGMLPLEISNDGQPGTTLNGSCSISGPGAAAFSQTPDNTFAVMQGGAADMSTLVCDSGQAVGMYTATLSCMHDGDSMPASPVNYDLTCNIVTAPSAEYGSMPAPGAAFNFGTFTTADPPADLVLTIENVGNADGLDGACSVTTNPNGAYSVDTGANYGPLAQMATAMRTVSCDTSVLGDHSGGVLSCTHNGTVLNSPVTYPLNCEVTPTPTYGSTPAPGGMLSMSADQGDADPTTSLLVDNDAGEMGSTLTGSCVMQGGSDPQITGGGGFSVPQGDPAQAIGLSCDASAQGTFNGTLSCTADPNTSNPGPHTYPVECIIGPPDPGSFDSTPPPGATIDLTPGGPVPEGTDLTNAGQLEVFNAGDPGDEDIDYTCTLTSTGEITQDPSPAMGTLVAGGASNLINYSCNTAADGSFTGTVSCIWSAPLEGVNEELYDVTCDVRDPFTEVVESPPSNTPQTADVGPGESHTFNFTFDEVQDEGADAELSDCSLASGADFSITAPASFPQTIPSGGSVQVDVQFTDPGAGDTFMDQLSCAYTHQPPPTGNTDKVFVSWPLEVTVVGRNATFRVTKDFNDDNPAGVEVFLECNTGLPLQQQAVIHDPDASGLGPGDFTFVDFVVVDFEPGTMDCDINETVPMGYSVDYFADVGDEGIAGNVFDDGEGCHYEDVESADFVCEISNSLDFVTVTVNKEWIDDKPEFQLPQFVEIEITCNEPVFFVLLQAETEELQGNGSFSQETFIQPGFPGVFGVFPHWDGSTECSVTETPEAGVLQDTSDCESIPLAPGVDGECTIVNTRLFAGIPTLSQYGLLVMALLMLGVGLVGFRRYA